MTTDTDIPRHFGVLLFPGFEALDVFGPLELVNDLSMTYDLTLSVIASTLDPVSTKWKSTFSVGQSIVPTCTFTDVSELDVLIIPGGFGAFEPTAELLKFMKDIVPKTKHVITVCNGSSLLAMTGVLDGRTATTNKAYWKQCTDLGPRVNWIAKARWAQDGKFWTSSGISAGIDAFLAWTASIFGEEKASHIANVTEFTRAKTSSDDPFSDLFGCQDVPPSTSTGEKVET